MNTKMLFAACAMILPLAIGAGAVSAKAPMNYDCSKAGNANKTACKTAAAAAKPAAANVETKTAAKASTSTSSMAKSSSMAKPSAMAPKADAKKPMNYDCSKAGNANKTACKTQSSMAAPAAKPMAPAAKPMAPVKPAATKPTNNNIVQMKVKNGKTYNYDCSKAGNKDLKVCKAH